MDFLILSTAVAMIAWTATKEEVFREPREWLHEKSQTCKHWWQRKLFYVWTCEFCLSHWVALVVLVICPRTLVYSDWRGYVLAFFSIVAIANVLMSVYSRLRVDIQAEKAKAKVLENGNHTADAAARPEHAAVHGGGDDRGEHDVAFRLPDGQTTR